MLIKRISARSFMGARHADIEPREKVLILAGLNGAGKSSIIEGAKAALLGLIDRVKLKKEYGQLVTEGESLSSVIVETDLGRCAMTLPNGKHESEFKAPATLGLVLDVHAFSRLDEGARRTLLMSVCNVATDADTIAKRLSSELDCKPSMVLDAMRPFAGSGFVGAEKFAREQASEARGAWKAITGKVWGSQQAATWEAPAVEPVSDEEMQAAALALDAAGDAVAESLRNQGAIEQQARAYTSSLAEIERLTEHAAKIDRINDKLQRDQAELTVWSEKLAALPPSSGAPAITLACPDCGAALVLKAGALERYEKPQDDPNLEVKRKSQKDAVALYTSSVENGKRDLLAAQQARVRLAELQAIEPVAEGAITAAKEHAKACSAAHSAAQSEHSALCARANAHRTAAEKTATAREHHEDVVQWLKLADALSPQGLPARIMSEALDPVNNALIRITDLAGWRHVSIGADMSIRAGGRNYALLSKGEQFRADVALTVAVSGLAGLGFVIIDGADILDAQGREDLLYALADEPGIQQAIIGMTLKAKPSGLPDGCEIMWIDAGYVAKEAGDAEKVAA